MATNRLGLFIFGLFLFLCSSTKAQHHLPYLEIEHEEDWAKIDVTQLKATYTFQSLLGDLDLHYTISNHSNDSVDVNFIYPHHRDQNLYRFSATINERTIELQSKPIRLVRQEIKQLTQRQNTLGIAPPYIRLELGKIPPQTLFTVVVSYTTLIPYAAGYYQFSLPERISKRSRSYTETFQATKSLKAYAMETEEQFTANGQLAFQSVILNGEEKTHPVKQTAFTINKTSPSATDFKYTYQTNAMLTNHQSIHIDGCDYMLGEIYPPAEIDSTILKPREYIFILDASGSMKGKPLEAAKELIRNVLNQLTGSDRFAIIFYGIKQTETSQQTLMATPDNISKAMALIDQTQAKGGLQLNDALQSLSNYRLQPNYNRIVTIVSDGKMTIESNIHLALKTHARYAQFFILGIGNDIDYRTMNFLALTTGYSPFIIDQPENIPQRINEFEKRILTPLLRNIRLQSSIMDLDATYPKNFNSFLSNEPLHFVTKDCHKNYPKQFSILGTNGSVSFDKTILIPTKQTEALSKAIQFYWVKQAIDYLLKEEDRCGERCKKDGRYRKTIEEIGTHHNVSTPYNLFIQNYGATQGYNDYDSDGDQVMDWQDNCPFERGDSAGKGCPDHRLNPTERIQKIESQSNSLLYFVEFDFDKAKIRPEDSEKLDQLSRLFKENPTLEFTLIGHTDAFGTEEHNNQLSYQRAKAVKDYLILRGIQADRIQLIAKGAKELKHPECAIAEQCSDWKNFENRRVIINIKKD